MSDSPYFQSRPKQYRGPINSDDFNLQQEELYKDITVIYNRTNFTHTIMGEGFRQALKNINALQRALTDLEERMDVIEANANTMSFYRTDHLDNDRFNGTPYEISTSFRNTLDTRYGLILLPRIETSSLSKLSFTTNGDRFVPPTLETRVIGVSETADSTSATIDTTEPEFAITRTAGRIWERNVIVSSPHVEGARCTLYVKAPTELFSTDKSNAILINPFPAQGTNILELAYTDDANFTLDSATTYKFFPARYISNQDAVGFVPPGSWQNGEDVDLYASRRAYYFDPTVITGLRLVLGQKDNYVEGTQYIYSYGLTDFDLRYDKFLNTGKMLLRFDAPTGQTISSVDTVTPFIWNIDEAAVPDVFSYRIIWETSVDSGVYTVTPVPLSKKIWVEVTLNATVNGGSPALSGLSVQYA